MDKKTLCFLAPRPRRNERRNQKSLSKKESCHSHGTSPGMFVIQVSCLQLSRMVTTREDSLPTHLRGQWLGKLRKVLENCPSLRVKAVQSLLSLQSVLERASHAVTSACAQ